MQSFPKKLSEANFHGTPTPIPAMKPEAVTVRIYAEELNLLSDWPSGLNQSGTFVE